MSITSLTVFWQIVLTVAEHHSNLVPWQLVAEKVGVVLKFATLTEDESIDIEQLKGLISNRTKLVALHHVSNTLGAISLVLIVDGNPLQDVCSLSTFSSWFTAHADFKY